MTLHLNLALVILAAIIPRQGIGAENVCVRNFTVGPVDLCQQQPEFYTNLVAADDPERQICSRIYPDDNCKFAAKEFDHVLTSDDQVVCVLNFYQPPIADACASNPDLYDWVLPAYPL